MTSPVGTPSTPASPIRITFNQCGVFKGMLTFFKRLGLTKFHWIFHPTHATIEEQIKEQIKDQIIGKVFIRLSGLNIRYKNPTEEPEVIVATSTSKLLDAINGRGKNDSIELWFSRDGTVQISFVMEGGGTTSGLQSIPSEQPDLQRFVLPSYTKKPCCLMDSNSFEGLCKQLTKSRVDQITISGPNEQNRLMFEASKAGTLSIYDMEFFEIPDFKIEMDLPAAAAAHLKNLADMAGKHDTLGLTIEENRPIKIEGPVGSVGNIVMIIGDV
jgi:hypothetical protein